MFNIAGVDGLSLASKKSRNGNEFTKKVEAHQSALVRSGLRELLDPSSPQLTPRERSMDSFNPSYSLQRKASGDFSSLSDRLSSGSPPLSVIHPVTLPTATVTPPAGTHNISFMDEYKHLFTPGCVIGQVQFKHTFRDYVISAQLMATYNFAIGDFVIVESHYDQMQVDLGILTKISTLESFLQLKALRGRSQDKEENSVGRILRTATLQERSLLVPKNAREIPLLDIAKLFASAHQLSMNVYGVEFQFDGKILFVYYTADSRVDYRGLVYDMVRECNHTRVKMKKTNQCRKFMPKEYATIALKTGQTANV